MTYPTSICTLDDVHSQLSIPSTDTSNDALLGLYIGAATEYANDFADQVTAATYTNEVHDGGAPQIILFHSPILTVASIIEYWGITPYPLTQSERGGVVTTYGYSIDNPNQGSISRVWSGLVGPFVAGDNNIVVTYTAGRAVTPDAIQLAVLQDIQVLYQQTKYGAGASPYGAPGAEPNENFNYPPLNAFPRLGNLYASSRRLSGIA